MYPNEQQYKTDDTMWFVACLIWLPALGWTVGAILGSLI